VTVSREQIMAAMLDLVDEQGYETTSLEQVLERAGARRTEFDDAFSSKEECALAILEEIATTTLRNAQRAYDGEAHWPDSLRAAAYAHAGWISENPKKVRFGMLEMLWASEEREPAADPNTVLPFSAETTIWSITQILAKRLREDGDLDPYTFVPELMYKAVLPHLGVEAAEKELRTSPPQQSWAPEGGYRHGVVKGESAADKPQSGPMRLPRGRHGLPRELIKENQRERLIAGIIAAVAENGYSGTTIAAITSAAGLSRRTFYEHFENKEACFAAAYEATLSHIRGTILNSAGAQEKWVERVRAGLDRLLSALAEDPGMASFFLIAPASAGGEIVDYHHLAMRGLVADLVEGAPNAAEASMTREQALAGGISRLVIGKLNAGEEKALPELLPDLIELVLSPYLGSEEAARAART
jgi:AcrR family transcriptional regulator